MGMRKRNQGGREEGLEYKMGGREYCYKGGKGRGGMVLEGRGERNGQKV